MKYSVTWVPQAETDLSAIWFRTRFRHLVTEAADKIDRELAEHPLDAGESRAGNVRIAFCLPLVVWYRVQSLDCQVFVMGVRFADFPPLLAVYRRSSIEK